MIINRTQWTFFAFFFVFELGSLLCAIAQSSKMLIVARAIAGLGGSGLLNGGLTMISACLPKHKRPAAMGMIISSMYDITISVSIASNNVQLGNWVKHWGP